ncbi:MAG: ABC transporter substrate-binding protein [Campylobacterota bacterium]|nr:ABC transporter substrate-binding protein [Campylobacterota bacterium]
MKIIKKFAIVVLLLSSIASAQQIKLITESWSPYQIKTDGELSGISVEIVQEIQKRVGNTQKIKVFPWNRGYNMTLKKDGYALFTTARTEEREKLFKWVGPIANLKLVMFKLKSNKTIYDTEEKAKQAKSIAVTKNDATEQVLASRGFKNLKVKAGGSNQSNLKKLLNGKTELWPAGYFAGHYRIKRLGVQDKVVITKAPPYLDLTLSIAFSKNTPDKTIKTWQKTLDEIKADGTYKKIISKYK